MLAIDLIKNRCPHCGKGHVYQKDNLATFGTVKMNSECPECHTDFTKEAGFYWGSMYASYGLALTEALIVYAICRLLGTQTFDMLNLVVVIAAVLVCSPFNFRMARLIWLYIFPKN